MGNDKDTWVAGMLIQIIYSKTKQNYKVYYPIQGKETYMLSERR